LWLLFGCAATLPQFIDGGTIAPVSFDVERARAIITGGARDLYRSAISLTGIDLILRAAATPTLRAYRSARSLTGIMPRG
jgi:hypothetical protein